MYAVVADGVSASIGPQRVLKSVENEMARRRFGIVVRALLRRHGLEAFRDGLEEGGVSREDMDERDQQALSIWLTEQSQYVTRFADNVFRNREFFDENRADIHAHMWANKSLRGAYQLGQASAAWNQPFRWRLGATEKHCRDCLRLNGQVHRMRDWRKKGFLPGSDKLECRGFNCDCKLVLARGERSRGRF